MLKIQSTVYPPSRNGEGNTVRPGGLWHCDHQNEFLNEARKCVQKPKRKDEVKEFAKIFWIVVSVMVVGIALYQLID